MGVVFRPVDVKHDTTPYRRHPMCQHLTSCPSAEAVDREAALFKQVVNPELRSGDDGRVGEAMNKARHLAQVDSRMKELMMNNVIDTFVP